MLCLKVCVVVIALVCVCSCFASGYECSDLQSLEVGTWNIDPLLDVDSAIPTDLDVLIITGGEKFVLDSIVETFKKHYPYKFQSKHKEVRLLCKGTYGFGIKELYKCIKANTDEGVITGIAKKCESNISNLFKQNIVCARCITKVLFDMSTSVQASCMKGNSVADFVEAKSTLILSKFNIENPHVTEIPSLISWNHAVKFAICKKVTITATNINMTEIDNIIPQSGMAFVSNTIKKLDSDVVIGDMWFESNDLNMIQELSSRYQEIRMENSGVNIVYTYCPQSSYASCENKAPVYFTKIFSKKVSRSLRLSDWVHTRPFAVSGSTVSSHMGVRSSIKVR